MPVEGPTQLLGDRFSLPGAERDTDSNETLTAEIQRLSARVAELERQNSAIESFAAIAAHELMEPLVLAEACATIVADRLQDRLDADSRRDLLTISRGAARGRLLIESLLQDARSSEGPLLLENVSLSEVVSESLELLAPQIEAHEAHVDVGPLPEVRGEAALLSVVLGNLVVNALKYSPRGAVDLRIDATRDGDRWCISVTSEGPAIAPEDRERIFEAFHRGRGERRARGAGLGLAICRRIVERHGGTIGVEPAVGGGNRFYFTLAAT